MKTRTPRLFPVLSLAALGAAILAPAAASAEPLISVEAGIGQFYRGSGWTPVRVRLSNQGSPAKVRVRARFTPLGQGAEEHLIPERTLQNGADEQHTLYIKSPPSYSSQPLTVDLFQDGRLVKTERPTLRLAGPDAWLVYGVGAPERTAALNLLSTLTPPSRAAVRRAGSPPNSKGQVMVGAAVPEAAPDRWQGLQAADMVVVSGVGERDLSPEQLRALREYAVAGGTLVVTGGANAGLLTTPFFQELLPVKPAGSGSASGFAGNSRGEPPPDAYPVVTASLKPGSRLLRGSAAQPLVVSGRKGSGRVVFLAFDPFLQPFRNWTGTGAVWEELLTQETPDTLLQAVERTDDEMFSGYYYGAAGATRLADAPFSIPQLDIPAFYVVALFLAAYIIILAPVNYFFLKSRDKKEYAWLTTPAIVLVFSVGAYLIGYASKGGSAISVKVGVIEAFPGQNAAPFAFYNGLFSPRKTAYDVRFAEGEPGRDLFAGALFSQPTRENSPRMTITQEGPPVVSDFDIDMWAMRVLKTQGVASLGGGISVRPAGPPGQDGEVRNGAPFNLTDCLLVADQLVQPLGDLPTGGVLRIPAGLTAGNKTPMALPAQVVDQARGDSQEARVKRAVLQSLTRFQNGGAGNSGVPGPKLLGWVKEPVGQITVDGRKPREVAQTLMVVHLQ